MCLYVCECVCVYMMVAQMAFGNPNARQIKFFVTANLVEIIIQLIRFPAHPNVIL